MAIFLKLNASAAAAVAAASDPSFFFFSFFSPVAISRILRLALKAADFYNSPMVNKSVRFLFYGSSRLSFSPRVAAFFTGRKHNSSSTCVKSSITRADNHLLERTDFYASCQIVTEPSK